MLPLILSPSILALPASISNNFNCGFWNNGYISFFDIEKPIILNRYK